MSVFRYINNSSEPVVAGDHTVGAWDEIILDGPTDELNFKVGTYLTCYKDGIQLDASSMPILDYVEVPSQDPVRLELYNYPESVVEEIAEVVIAESEPAVEQLEETKE